ncbi:MAG TPA: methylated-DNA--[protein]-cysteine S-methyltransferase [Bryobacteraceae bacterium]|nr:methylated-DNA--[protein]-cysteine S-methyltransferase [Bryobacteraceae bacterium]
MREWTEIEPAAGLRVRITAGGAGIQYVDLDPGAAPAYPRNDANWLLREAARQLQAYFDGRLAVFNLPLEMEGTPFQRRVWAELVEIPYGETRSYAEVAAAIGAPRAVRAVGAANGRNPAPIVVPCHRVIGAGGKLVGYGGGLALKRRLLDLEAEHVERFREAATR